MRGGRDMPRVCQRMPTGRRVSCASTPAWAAILGYGAVPHRANQRTHFDASLKPRPVDRRRYAASTRRVEVQAILASMWVDEDGVAHTVALPEPQQLMSKSFRRALDQLRRSHPTQIDEILSNAEDAIFSDGAVTPDEPGVRAHYEGHPPPIEILQGDPRTPDDLAQTINQVEPRWRLDAVLALQDYVD